MTGRHIRMLAVGVLAFLAAGACVLAQTNTGEPKEINVKVFTTDNGWTAKSQTATFTFVASEMGFESRVVKAAPFSADTVTEFTQTLSNGQHIYRKSTASLYRDSEGRTRREQTIEAIGPYSPSGPAHKTISINDPVAGTNFILDPDNRLAIMNKFPAGSENVVVSTPFGPYVTARKPGETGAAGGVGVVAHSESSGMMVATKTPFGIIMAPAKPGSESSSRTESLGVQMIEGVQAEGTRSIETIATGAIGNDSPIEIVSERWYSPELEMVVKSTRSDPMSGENVYQLKNIRRGDPPASLFQVPAEYTIKEGTVIKTTIKKEGNQ